MLYISALIIPILLLPAPFRLSNKFWKAHLSDVQIMVLFGLYNMSEVCVSVFFFKQGCQQRDGATKKVIPGT